ncbi:MAG: hypothetical protein ACJAXA_000431 [Candidatus Aldehydirespiratoraceae bacterium]
MTIGWIDGLAGVSGDMLLAALVDVGVPLDVVQAPIDAFNLGIVVRAESVTRAGLGATKVHVDVPSTDTIRHLGDIVDLLSRLEAPIRDRSVAVFQRLAEAEAVVHQTSIDDVHFHEVGALDSIADIVGVCAGLAHLGLTALHCSTLSLGSGMTRGAHGPIPVPAPAVLQVLKGIGHVTAGPAPYEATTPTGAALLAQWVTSWSPMPTMSIIGTGMGAGTKDSNVVANVCRLILGELDATTGGEMMQLDANVDDLDPRVWPEAIAAAMSAGAVDAWVTPIIMKKGRPAHTFSALCPTSRIGEVADSIFGETSTIGIRQHTVTRHVLERTTSTVEVDGQTIGVKHAVRGGEVVNQSVEWDDVVSAAQTLGTSANDVLRRATSQLD